MQMPFGKLKGQVLCDLPVSYLEWFQRKGFPKGKLGILLGTLYEIKVNGLEYLLKPLKQWFKKGCQREYASVKNTIDYISGKEILPKKYPLMGIGRFKTNRYICIGFS